MSQELISDSIGISSMSMDTAIEIESLKKEVDSLKAEVDVLGKLIRNHDTELNDRRKITNTYVDTILSKIEILKNMIKANVGDTEEFISPNLIMVESIEEQIKLSGKISDKQFKTLNDIYLKQKRV